MRDVQHGSDALSREPETPICIANTGYLARRLSWLARVTPCSRQKWCASAASSGVHSMPWFSRQFTRRRPACKPAVGAPAAAAAVFTGAVAAAAPASEDWPSRLLGCTAWCALSASTAAPAAAVPPGCCPVLAPCNLCCTLTPGSAAAVGAVSLGEGSSCWLLKLCHLRKFIDVSNGITMQIIEIMQRSSHEYAKQCHIDSRSPGEAARREEQIGTDCSIRSRGGAPGSRLPSTCGSPACSSQFVYHFKM
jgi:hypothetical protein